MSKTTAGVMAPIPAQGENISVIGDTYRILLSGAQTGGAFAIIDMLVPPGGGPGPHSHAKMQETFYVIAGAVVVKTKALTYTARKGSFFRIPLGGVVHSFKNRSESTAHLLCTVVPAGLDTFFRKIGKPVAAGKFLPPVPPTKKELARLAVLAKKYGQKLFPPDYLESVPTERNALAFRDRTKG
jgi:quercetin dioxygenase-like cupin family protein